MAITPNYSWPLPDDTDLVKDGAEAIRDLGNAIDTTVDGLPGAGLVHIETQDITAGVSAVDFNNVFSSSFTNYRIIGFVVHSDGTASTQVRLRTAGSSNTTSNYDSGIGLSTSAGNFSSGITSAGSLFVVAGNVGLGGRTFSLDFLRPNLSLSTAYTGTLSLNRFPNSVSGGFTLTTVFDGISFIASAGNFTSGKITIYGYKD